MSNKEEEGCAFFVLAIVIVGMMIACTVGGCESGKTLGREEEKQNAIKSGVARWVVNPTTGEKTFKYGVK